MGSLTACDSIVVRSVEEDVLGVRNRGRQIDLMLCRAACLLMVLKASTSSASCTSCSSKEWRTAWTTNALRSSEWMFEVQILKPAPARAWHRS